MSITWIILLVSIGGIAIFLFWSSRRDKKKRKEIDAKKEKMKLESQAAKGNVAIWVLEVKKISEKVLANFTPSIGKYKMSDIKNGSKNAMEALIRSRSYKLVAIDEENNDLIKATHELAKEPVNNWTKKMEKEMSIIENASKVSGQEYETFRKEAIKLIKAEFDKINKEMLKG